MGTDDVNNGRDQGEDVLPRADKHQHLVRLGHEAVHVQLQCDSKYVLIVEGKTILLFYARKTD